MSDDTSYRLSAFAVTSLWGYRTIDLNFYDDVNVIIGPNASGKTTIINLLQYVLTGNLSRIVDFEFDEITVDLKAFAGKSVKQIKVQQKKDELHFLVGGKKIDVPLDLFPDRYDRDAVLKGPSNLSRRHLRRRGIAFRSELEGLVPAVWLPVSRRLPVDVEEETHPRPGRLRSMESVDESLSELVDRLRQYRIMLDSSLSELRKEFQRHALENILYDRRHDSLDDFESFTPPTNDEKDQLLKAFRDVGLADKSVEKRIEQHFSEAQAVADKLSRGAKIDIPALVIIPLINRTKSMIGFAQELEDKRQALFHPLKLYEHTVNSFLNDKRIQVSDKGELEIASESRPERPLNWRQLSSGEKQILILLTQALLWEKEPVVYVADEPELSLHVLWQERLLKSLRELAGKCQLIVATHSPDIAGAFNDRVIDLAKV